MPHNTNRYSRQLLLPAFGPSCQSSLSSAVALIVGAGGLGCPAALYLAGAGVGRLLLVDNGDCVEESNLHRQIGHSSDRIGAEKTQSLAVAIAALNPEVAVEAIGHDGGLRPANAQQLVRRADVVLDCTDNVISRYLVNDACVLEGKPLVSGSAIGLEGQLAVYGPGSESPCYRCVFPAPPPPQCVGRCDTAGVLGPIPGVIGTMQALEAIKILSEFKWSKTLQGRMLLFDGAEARFRDVKMRKRNPTCRVCGEPGSDKITATGSYNYELFTTGGLTATPLDSSLRLDPLDFKKAIDSGKYTVIDVRTKEQFDLGHLEGAMNVPMDQLKRFTQTLAPKSSILVVCRKGNDSQEAAKSLIGVGMHVMDLIGGLEAWRNTCDSSLPVY